MTVKEGVHQRIGQADDFDNRYELGASDLPERCLRKVFAPEDLPASDGASVGTEASGKFADSAWCRPLPHGTDYDDDGGEVDFWAEEANRGGCRSLPATVAIAAEAQSEALFLGQLYKSAPGLPEIVGAVEVAAAGTCFLAGRLCKVLVDGQKDRPELAVRGKS